METLRELVDSLESFGDAPAVSWKSGKDVRSRSYRELFHRIMNYSRGFMSLGLQPGDRVVLLSHNHPEWIAVSLGLNNAGLVDVPRGENTTPDEVNYLIEHSRAAVVIVQNKKFLDIVEELDPENLEMIISLEKLPGTLHTEDILARGKNSKAVLPESAPSTTASLIYTSGTTSMPKGVELTHGNFCSNIRSLLSVLPISSADKLISVLPAWHAFERIAKYMALAVGAETFYSSWRGLRGDLIREQPTIMASVPRIWEMIYNGVMKKVKERGGWGQRFFSMGMKIALDYAGRKHWFDPVRLAEYPLHRYMSGNVFSKLHERLGGRFRFAFSGGSSLPRHVDDFFRAAGVEIVEGYGLTETSPVISVRNPGKATPYTVGAVLPETEARIIDQETGAVCSTWEKGVLYVRGPNVMKGYYRNHSETSKVLHHDGWFNTGDIGYFTAGGELVITGREKDIIVLSNGENINPVPIEDALKESDFIAEAIMVGQEWKQPGALIVPDFENLRDYCDEAGMTYEQDNLYRLFSTPEIQKLYRGEIDRLVNTRSWCKPYERINTFRLACESFKIGKELTPTMKPKRAIIAKLYKKLIQNLWLSIHQ